MRRQVVFAILTAAVGSLLPHSLLEAKVYLTQEEALAMVFADPGKVERKTAFLTRNQVLRIQEIAGVPVESKVITFYLGEKNGGGRTAAFFDTHTVRTLPETLLIVVDPEGKLEQVTVLTFLEPTDYLPRGKWYEQFDGKTLGKDLFLERGIHGITGASLTSRAAIRAVRRILAIHSVLREEGGIEPREPGGSDEGHIE
ncbi:MAG: FMN-binding protein [Acidobacteria bacterium]|nr:FMN-binding protein [Acidobacteriota bacterium]